MQVTFKQRGVCGTVHGDIYYSASDAWGPIEIKAKAKVEWHYLLSEINWATAYVCHGYYLDGTNGWMTAGKSGPIAFAMRPLFIRARDIVMQSRFMRRNNDPDRLEIVEEEVKRLLLPLNGE